MPLNPYSRLKAEFQKFVAEINAVPPSLNKAFWWTKANVEANGMSHVRDIREQVMAARTLGKETIVVENAGALEFYFRNPVPKAPYV